MRDLEQRSDAEGLGEVGAEPREAQIGEEDISLDFFGNVLNSSRVGEPQCFSPLRERCIQIL